MHLGDSITKDFTLQSPTTGIVSDADFLPTCDVFEDTTDVAILSPTVTKRVGHDGNYRVSFDVTSANGFEVGKSYNVIADATVGGVRAKARITTFNVDAVITPIVRSITYPI